jgi:hypothetical protein
MLEVFRSSLEQWLKGSPGQMVLEHLDLQDSEEGRKFMEVQGKSSGKACKAFQGKIMT